MLVRFPNADGCVTCTQTIDFNKLRAIGMLKNDDSDNSYYVRLSFEDSDTFVAKKGMTLAQATEYRNTLEGYWLSSNKTPASSFSDTSVVVLGT